MNLSVFNNNFAITHTSFFCYPQQAPSAYMAEMALTTDERLKLTYEMRVPQIIELLDMSEQSLQKVHSN